MYVKITLDILCYLFNGWNEVENLKKSDTKPKTQQIYITMENTCFGLLLGQQVTCGTEFH